MPKKSKESAKPTFNETGNTWKAYVFENGHIWLVPENMVAIAQTIPLSDDFVKDVMGIQLAELSEIDLETANIHAIGFDSDQNIKLFKKQQSTKPSTEPSFDKTAFSKRLMDCSISATHMKPFLHFLPATRQDDILAAILENRYASNNVKMQTERELPATSRAPKQTL